MPKAEEEDTFVEDGEFWRCESGPGASGLPQALVPLVSPIIMLPLALPPPPMLPLPLGPCSADGAPGGPHIFGGREFGPPMPPPLLPPPTLLGPSCPSIGQAEGLALGFRLRLGVPQPDWCPLPPMGPRPSPLPSEPPHPRFGGPPWLETMLPMPFLLLIG